MNREKAKKCFTERVVGLIIRMSTVVFIQISYKLGHNCWEVIIDDENRIFFVTCKNLEGSRTRTAKKISLNSSVVCSSTF